MKTLHAAKTIDAMPNTPTKCQSLADDLSRKELFFADLNAEYGEATGIEKSRLFYLMRSARAQVAQARAALERCVNPPPPLPDLRPTDVRIQWHADRSGFDFAILVHNDGAPVSGPFKITAAVEYSDYSQDPPLDVFRSQDFIVPAAMWIQPGDTYTSEYFHNVPFLLRPGTAIASYTFYALVDADGQIRESIEANNNLQVTKLLKVPRIVIPPVGPAKTG